MQTYDAFISYSHHADKQTAPTLQRGLENLNRRWLGRRRLRIFRDETDLSASPSLWGVIQEALDSSRFFILLASPKAANSKWVDQEVRRWLEIKPADKILLVVTDGEFRWSDARHDFDLDISTAIPPALFGAFPEEPLLLDLRNVKLGRHRNPKAQDAIATLAAPIHGKSKQDLLALEVQLIRRRLVITSLALASIAVLATGFSWQFVEATRMSTEAERQAAEAKKQSVEATAQRDIATRMSAEAERQAAEAKKQRDSAI